MASGHPKILPSGVPMAALHRVPMAALPPWMGMPSIARKVPPASLSSGTAKPTLTPHPCRTHWTYLVHKPHDDSEEEVA